jgi:methylated-DNA-[protein]-cysteine S-methyltransferase
MATTTTTTTTMTSTKSSKPTPAGAMPPSKLPLPPPLLTSPRGTPFERAVWSLTYQIPAGSFSTYALLAAHLRSSPRAVGNALRRNPFAPEIPWYVLRSLPFPVPSQSPPPIPNFGKTTQ